jgi:hypothetical protein
MNEILKAGTYYLGDPSDVLPNKILIGIWYNLYKFDNGKFNIYDTDFVVHSTHNGDGTFIDSDNKSYEVHSGCISLIDVTLIDDIEICNKEKILKFDKDINFIYKNGIFYIKSDEITITIDTRNSEENISDEELEDDLENDHFEDDNLEKNINNENLHLNKKEEDLENENLEDNNEENFENDNEEDFENDNLEDDNEEDFEKIIKEYKPKNVFFKKKD